MYIKPTKADLDTAKNKTIHDVIKPNLKVLFCGINPGLYTAATGHHFARPGNRFWKSLYYGGFTDRLFHPSEQSELLKLGYGITNVVARTTNAASELSKEEIVEGGKILRDKVLQFKHQILAILGIGTYKLAFQKPKAKIGLQEDKIGETKIYILPNPSGLNANFQQEDFNSLFKDLKNLIEV